MAWRPRATARRKADAPRAGISKAAPVGSLTLPVALGLAPNQVGRAAATLLTCETRRHKLANVLT